ncbi:exosome complex component MTR3 [Aplysia californica]|uniref:Exosome complex component MTR3 n=1 Tax=Aplysia californica TaxID=6500 RepID=A0ABM0K1J5_APLCA|nr:exosome complex component MTR3 [Aplysia californica]
MPTDTRRIQGPETSNSPYDFCPTATSDPALLEKQRLDGRDSAQMRPLFLRAGVISQARGSAYIEMNQTKAICAVYGPREVQRREDFSLKGQLTCQFRFATFASQHRRQHQQGNQEKDLSVQMLEALEPAVCLHKYPKSQINVYVTVLQHDGSVLSAGILCASLALASAGVEMYDLVIASSAAMYNDLTISDPTVQEEQAVLSRVGKGSSGMLTVAFMPSINQVSAITSDGGIQFDTLNKTVRTVIDNCQKLYPVLQQTLVKHIEEKKKGISSK